MNCSVQKKRNRISSAIDEQLSNYPKSTLQDIYKNFFQDKFGPGHLLKDTTSAGVYLRTELNSYDSVFGKYYESTGYEGNFYRVNLSVIKNGLIPYPVFFDAFVRSAENVHPILPEEWIKEWNLIVDVMGKKNISLDSYDSDKKQIAKMFTQEKFVMHHSKIFNENYQPHYRIIGKNIFEKELLPLINKQKLH